MHTDTLSSTDIPLNKLVAWNGNVRLTGADQGIRELASSIAAVGLLQSLVVRKQPRGKYAVIAGKRRLLALSHLADTGTLESNWLVPCRLATEDANLTEISLTENVMRTAMHPADEYEAFHRLITEGKCVADIAARFGVTEAVVNRRLALARVSPVLLQQYREGQLNLEILQVFTLTDDHIKQEEVWNSLQSWNRSAHTIRHLLSQNTIAATDKRVRFVGLEQYEAEGGLVRRNLFAEGEHGIEVLDTAKLMRLAEEKLQTLAEQERAAGWKWVEVQTETDPQPYAKLRRIAPQQKPLSTEEENTLNDLLAEREVLEQKLNEAEEDEANDSMDERMGEIADAIDLLYHSQTAFWPEEIRARCGVVISLSHNGEAAYTRGLLRKEDERALRQAPQTTPAREGTDQNPHPDQSNDSEPDTAFYPASLVETLTMHKTAAIAVELTRQPQIALAAVVHALVIAHFGLHLHLYRSQSCLQISATQPNLQGAAASPAFEAMEEQRNHWLAQMPRSADELWSWCLKQGQETLLQLLAFCAAKSVNAVQAKHESPQHLHLQHANHLATALNFDMAQWFTPTTDNFFSKISKSQIAAALTEAGKPAPDLAQWKKAELASFAETEVQATGWLPAPVRLFLADRENQASDIPVPSESPSEPHQAETLICLPD